ncbi:peptidase G2 [Bacillus haynesii]|uniref:peptidase G2 autoproteolytic cleavage domain-containing protein n=1 Tax=Bacillus haynesii TaxID=1925021 RepID=UPI0022825FD5|nr:peptidase G2 autoproteolytic cleavage domain-containing protein [Bacillus haynesii]MCY8438030.1 peptidase G2 [Bacillus haynesii]
MIRLIKDYDHTRNSRHQAQLRSDIQNIENTLNEHEFNLKRHESVKAAHTSEQIDHGGFTVGNRLENLSARFANLVTNHDGSDVKEVVDARVTTDGEIAQTLKDRLDLEFNRLAQKIQRTVYVDDFGAVPDGKTDSTEAFKKALGNGRVRIELSAGTYIVKGIKLPSWTYLNGKGKGITTIKLHEDTPASEWVITNADYEKGNRNIFVQGMSLDWNPNRQGGVRATGGQHSSCLTLANVKYGWVKDVEAINPGLHGFDITAPTYDHLPTTDYTKNGSRYIWLDNCVAYGYGDDGITTHYSEYIFISNSHCVYPSGKAHKQGESNSNGIEIDDGSKHAWILNCYSEGNVRGVEVKAHAKWPAAQNVHVIGHVSYRDVRSYDIRHIGHHLASDPESTTAYGVTITDCTAIEPVFNSLYKDLSPRALVISAYKNVVVNGFTAIGDPSYDYKNYPAIALQYRSRNISLNGIQVRGFKKAEADIRLFGGNQRTDNVNISNFTFYKSAKSGIVIGGGVYNVNINNGIMTGDKGAYGITSPNSQANIVGVYAEGYDYAAMIKGQKYKYVPNNLKGGTRVATTSGYATSETGFIAASSGDPVASGEASSVIGSTGGCKAQGTRNVVIGSSDRSTATKDGSRSVIGSSNNVRIEGDGVSRTILSSQAVINNKSYTVALGYGTGSPSASNKKVEINAKAGNVLGTGRIESVSDLKDLAEYFESKDGSKINSGYLVTLDGDKIRKAEKGEKVLGVISETAGVIMGGAAFYWNDRYLRNEFGGIIYEEIDVESEDKDGNVVIQKELIPKETPYYNPDVEYIPREERDEWHVVGLVGQVYVRIDDTVQAGDSIVPSGGIGTKSEDGTGFYVMRIKQPYSHQKGYGVALVFMYPQL